MNSYKGNIEPEEGIIFVFGSNYQGFHGAGSAKVALEKFGAVYGEPIGLFGNSYALPTTDLYDHRQLVGPWKIIENIALLYRTASVYPEYKFMVAYRNESDEKTLCGYAGKDMMAMFRLAAVQYGKYPDNIYFSEEWVNSGLLDL